MKHKHGDCVQCEDNERQQIEWARKIEEQLESYVKNNAVFRISVFYREMNALVEEMK